MYSKKKSPCKLFISSQNTEIKFEFLVFKQEKWYILLKLFDKGKKLLLHCLFYIFKLGTPNLCFVPEYTRYNIQRYFNIYKQTCNYTSIFIQYWIILSYTKSGVADVALGARTTQHGIPKKKIVMLLCFSNIKSRGIILKKFFFFSLWR